MALGTVLHPSLPLNALTSIGDFDGDGYDDLIVNSAQSIGSSFTGDVLVIKGLDDLNALSANTLALTVPLEMLEDFLFGIELTAGGDVNGDGAPDIIVAGVLRIIVAQPLLCISAVHLCKIVPIVSLQLLIA